MAAEVLEVLTLAEMRHIRTASPEYLHRLYRLQVWMAR